MLTREVADRIGIHVQAMRQLERRLRGGLLARLRKRLAALDIACAVCRRITRREGLDEDFEVAEVQRSSCSMVMTATWQRLL